MTTGFMQTRPGHWSGNGGNQGSSMANSLFWRSRALGFILFLICCRPQ